MEEFFNRLVRPYSITYAERPAGHCPPRVLRSERVTKMLEIRRKGPKTRPPSEAVLSAAVKLVMYSTKEHLLKVRPLG